jgi:hypothetical protein
VTASGALFGVKGLLVLNPPAPPAPAKVFPPPPPPPTTRYSTSSDNFGLTEAVSITKDPDALKV